MITEEEFQDKGTETSIHSHIKGWGIDADPTNDPTHPMKKKTNEEQLGYTWERPSQQAQDNVEILRSNERDNLTAVFGSTLPPSGLSGAFRRFAFKYSESDYRHWLPLMLADRINNVEGIGQDLKHGKMPNFIKERGLKSVWKHNKKVLIRKAAVRTVIIAGIALILFKRNK